MLFSFNPHTHAGCDFEQDDVVPELIVSIHTPTQGVTQGALTEKQVQTVSIHTPTQGVTARNDDSTAIARFNPHTHAGCDSYYVYP